MVDGQRIKLDDNLGSEDSQHARSSLKKAPVFDLDFSVLEDGTQTADDLHIPGSDSDSDLPDAHELVRDSILKSAGPEGAPTRTSDYSDPEMDALIREANIDGPPRSKTGKTGAVGSINKMAQKRKLDASDIQDYTTAPVKRTKKDISPLVRTPSPRLPPEEKRTPLFYLSSEESLVVPVEDLRSSNDQALEDNADFVLDESLFNFVDSGQGDTGDAPPAEQTSSLRPSPPAQVQLPTFRSEEPSFYVSWKEKQKEAYGADWTPVPASPVTSTPVEPEYDHFAEFEQWLATTDSIEFTD
ncbi:hypothetical protein BC834DRAFT_966000 [Gloeopeniophorella convolvens]|nr:hypothetical protein BC834DRAFT_966000 [Gloeopeniophorella convolvens]